MFPKISVIVPVYKVEQYLPRCVDSILSQSFTDFELILVDDGSPDNSGKICEEYAQKDNRIRVFHKLNGGVSSARNLGLDNAQGKWVVFIDSDDYVERGYLQELIEIVKEYKTEFVSIDVFEQPILQENVYLLRKDFRLLFTKYKIDKFCPPWGKLYNRNLIEQCHLRFNPTVHIGEDVMFVLLYILNLKSLVLLKSDKYVYERMNQESLTKCVFDFEIELSGKIEFERVFALVIDKLCLGESETEDLSMSMQLYVERTMNSIMRIPKRKERVDKLSSLDLRLYLKYKRPHSWKEAVILFLLRIRAYYLYDYLLTFKR